MSIECSECERDARGGHDESCSRHPDNKKEVIMDDINAPSPYSNCSFKHCDLRGQCIGEGKCHHPALEISQPQEEVTCPMCLGKGSYGQSHFSSAVHCNLCIGTGKYAPIT